MLSDKETILNTTTVLWARSSFKPLKLLFENYSAVDVLENHCWAHRRFFKSIHFLEQVWFKCESHHRFFPVVTSLIHEESHMSPTKSLFDVGSRRISIFIVNIYISLGCSGNTTRIMRRTLYVYFLTFHIVWNSKYIDKCVLMRFIDDLLALDSIVHFWLSETGAASPVSISTWLALSGR